MNRSTVITDLILVSHTSCKGLRRAHSDHLMRPAVTQLLTTADVQLAGWQLKILTDITKHVTDKQCRAGICSTK